MLRDINKLGEIKKVGILGGTFDPIHCGHISVAKEILKKTDIEKIIFVPSGMPPHKNLDNVSDSQKRLEMVQLAVSEENDMLVSSIEIEREGLTYTIDTIKSLHTTLGKEISLKFITGADAIEYIKTWKDYEKLLGICSFIAVTRPGYNKNNLINIIDNIEKNIECNIEFVEINSHDISSSQIRTSVKKGEEISELVPRKVEQFIYENRLYSNVE